MACADIPVFLVAVTKPGFAGDSLGGFSQPRVDADSLMQVD